MYVVLCTAWSLFSGPTHYISLATAAFFGIGTYTVGLGLETLPFPALVLIAGGAAALLAGLVGLATLRLSGVYFVIFTLGLAELVRQVVTWLQTNFTTSVGLYVFTDFREQHIFWMLLGMAALVFFTSWAIGRSKLGFAMRIIGNDETVAKHSGIDTARAKVLLFMISGAFIGMVGAILAPRFAYVEPPSAFNTMISFQVVIMALLGGTSRIWGPLVGVIPFTILMDQVSSNFPNHTSLVIGIAFMAIVYGLPGGVVGRLEQAFAAVRQARGGRVRAAEKERTA
jgi:branched-chain amino acid transport system permease protein